MIPGHTLYCCAMRRRKKAARVRVKGFVVLAVTLQTWS